jgi:hypothetical protein
LTVGAIVLVMALFALGNHAISWAQSTDCYMMQGGNKWVCDNGGEIELQTGAVLDVQTGANASLADLTLAKGTAISLTMNATLTPNGTYQPLQAAGNVSTASITAGTAGDVLVLVNESNVTITFTDTGTLKLSGNAALAQYDALTLSSDGTNWVEIAQADN